MNVTDPVIDGFGENAVYELDDRSIICGELVIFIVFLGSIQFHIPYGCRNQGAEILDLYDRFFFVSFFFAKEAIVLLIAYLVVFSVRLHDIIFRGDAKDQLPFDFGLQLFNCRCVRGFRHGDLESLLIHLQGKGHIFFGYFIGHQLLQTRVAFNL